MVHKLPKFFPGIDEYLLSIDNKKSVTAKGLEEFIATVQVKTGLNKQISTMIVKYFFHEIRSSMLRGNTVAIRGLGKFYISNPRYSKYKERVFPTFKPYKQLVRKLNDS